MNKSLTLTFLNLKGGEDGDMLHPAWLVGISVLYSEVGVQAALHPARGLSGWLSSEVAEVVAVAAAVVAAAPQVMALSAVTGLVKWAPFQTIL